jgi:hypothetical protein
MSSTAQQQPSSGNQYLNLLDANVTWAHRFGGGDESTSCIQVV